MKQSKTKDFFIQNYYNLLITLIYSEKPYVKKEKKKKFPRAKKLICESVFFGTQKKERVKGAKEKS